jgi:branched-chain amino acid transport system ATP-binding protein
MTPLLAVNDIHTYYGESHVLQGVSLSVDAGRVVALLGRNGVGKTTTIQSILGLPAPRAGDILLREKKISGLPTYEIVRSGIGWVPQGHRIFPTLTVRENLTLAARYARPGAWNLGRVFTLFPSLAERAGLRGSNLSGGEQQMLAIGRALMGEPKLLALDEPSLGLSPKMVSTVFESIQTIAKSGITILLVEQNTRAALAIAQRGYVLSAGRVVHEGAATDLAQSEMVQKAFVGAAFTKQSVRTSRRERRLAQSNGGGAGA